MTVALWISLFCASAVLVWLVAYRVGYNEGHGDGLDGGALRASDLETEDDGHFVSALPGAIRVGAFGLQQGLGTAELANGVSLSPHDHGEPDPGHEMRESILDELVAIQERKNRRAERRYRRWNWLTRRLPFSAERRAARLDRLELRRFEQEMAAPPAPWLAASRDTDLDIRELRAKVELLEHRLSERQNAIEELGSLGSIESRTA